MKREPYQHRVAYYETDKMGVAHHSNYIRWMEEARIDMLDKAGMAYDVMESKGVISPVVSVNCKYKYPSYFNDVIEITTNMIRYTGVRFVIGYEMKNMRTGKLVCSGQTEHCFTDQNGHPIMIDDTFPDISEILKAIATENN